MKNIVQAGILFLLSSCSQTINNEIESTLHNCLIESYADQNIDINRELDRFETYLIKNKFLKSSSGKSYYEFFNQIAESDEHFTYIDQDKFQNIFKLAPDEFYNFSCLQRLKRIDSSVIINSKYHEMTLAIRKASSKETSSSNIALAITGVLAPSDFDHSYYRAIALLTMAYTSDADSGLLRQIYPDEKVDYSEFAKIEIELTDKEEILIDGVNSGLRELKNVLRVFIEANKSTHSIQLKTDKATSYDHYLNVQDQITLVYHELRNDLAAKKFNRHYLELTEVEQKEIKITYPSNISEKVME